MTAVDETSRADGPICTVEDLRVELSRSRVDVVDDLHIDLEAGRIVGLVGESGSGKTTAGTALLGYARIGAEIAGGRIMVAGHDVRSMSAAEVRRIRGVDIAYVPQDPSSALNPAIRIGPQLRELLDLHNLGEESGRDARIREILPEVGLPADDEFLRRYPHQLSGGQVQRVALAMVFLPRPKVLVLDEPTTGLDVTTQGMVLRTLDDLCEKFSVAALYVTHDLAVVASIADRVAVMYAGRLVEEGPTAALFLTPSHPYTRALLRSIPHLDASYHLTGIPGRTPSPGNRPAGCRFNDRCEYAIDACRTDEPPPVQVGTDHWARCIRTDELGPYDTKSAVVPDTDPDKPRVVILDVKDLNVFHGRNHVVHDVSFDLGVSEVVALVGESGSGKTTISRCVGGLHKQWEGRIAFHDNDLATGARARSAADRQRIQYIFQNPYLSLNPRRTVGQILVRPLEIFGIARGRAARERAAELLDAVQLGERTMDLRTSRLSGGERQRVAIARALAADPEILVCDEITSALDVSIQGSITELLLSIKESRGISMLFVTHNLPLVRTIADRVLVLEHGRLIESGPVVQVLSQPTADYTRRLLANTPSGDRAMQ